MTSFPLCDHFVHSTELFELHVNWYLNNRSFQSLFRLIYPHVLDIKLFNFFATAAAVFYQKVAAFAMQNTQFENEKRKRLIFRVIHRQIDALPGCRMNPKFFIMHLATPCAVFEFLVHSNLSAGNWAPSWVSSP